MASEMFEEPLLCVGPRIEQCTYLAPYLIAFFSVYFFDGLECVGHSFAYVSHFVFEKDV
jgi:hypothetical protein